MKNQHLKTLDEMKPKKGMFFTQFYRQPTWMAVILKTCAGLILYTYLYCRLLTYTYPKQASKLLAKIM